LIPKAKYVVEEGGRRRSFVIHAAHPSDDSGILYNIAKGGGNLIERSRN